MRHKPFLVERRQNFSICVDFPFDYSLMKELKKAHRGIVSDKSKGGLFVRSIERFEAGFNSERSSHISHKIQS
jgi:hypothetical protein